MKRLATVALVLGCFAGPSLALQTSQSADDGTSAEALRATAALERIRAERDAYEADQLVERAARLEARGSSNADAEAEPLYAKAVQLDPTNERARTGLAGTRERLGLLPDQEATPLLDRSQREMRAKRQEMTYRFNALLAAARAGIAKGQPEGFQAARLQLDRARLLRASANGLVSPGEAQEMNARLDEYDLAVTRAAQAREDAERDATRRDQQRRIKAARVHDKRL